MAVGVMTLTAKEELVSLVKVLDDDGAREALDYVKWRLQAEDTLTIEEARLVGRGEAELARGDRVSLGELKNDLGL